jgi:HAD superfamily hydrolase (TIGR01509 family)
MTRPRAGVLVDCDGTLLDTNYLHALAWSRALRDVGEWAPMNAIHRLIGMGGDQLVPELLGHDVEGAHDAHDRRYRELRDDMRAFRGAGDFLRRLHEAGLVVVLASSANEEDLAAMREVLDADDAIDEAVHADEVDRSKPHADIFDTAREKAGLDARCVVVVGDTVWDVEAADRAGMGCVAVESGGTSRHELAEAGALAVYRDVEQLGAQLLTSPIGTLLAVARGA